jgi:hypothetical protein
MRQMTKRAVKLAITIAFFSGLLIILSTKTSTADRGSYGEPVQERTPTEQARLLDHGRYLATIGVCAACHTPPAVSPMRSASAEEISRERRFRTDPDWFSYLDPEGQGKLVMAGGVPFIIRLGADKNQTGVVYSRNLTPDETGLGGWSEDDIVKVLRTGVRKDGSNLFLFPPHTFYKNLTEEDARALAFYLKRLAPVKNRIVDRQVPPVVLAPESPAFLKAIVSPMVPRDKATLASAPVGRTPDRAKYLLDSLVGCTECHSYHNEKGELVKFVGGDPKDFTSAFRYGPDLPLRQEEKGFATFPFPGYAVLYSGNLTRFGLGGDLSHVPASDIVRAIRQGISTQLDKYGRPQILAHVMLWQFYSSMTDDDAYAIAEYIKSLQFIKHDIGPRVTYYGEDWEAAFERVFGAKPSANDAEIFGKTNPSQEQGRYTRR